MKSIIIDGEINISKNLWAELNASHSKEFIKEYIADTILSNNIPMPTVNITREDMLLDYSNLLKMDTSSILTNSQWFSRYDYIQMKSDTVIRSSKIGNKSSNFFHQENRWLCGSCNSPSPYRTWNNKKFLLTLLNCLWSMKFERIDSQVLRTAIGLRKYIASQFRPSAAKLIYNYFGVDSVLDFSAGWGDRLSGFCASNATKYVGIDPNTNLFDGYRRQIETYGHGKNIQMINACAENTEIDCKFDMVFTSPPYFNIERYTEDPTQSYKKYRKFDDWHKNFLLKTIGNSYEYLNKGGYMIINISDVYSGHRVNRICDSMNTFIYDIGMKYIGCWGYEMRKRVSSGAIKGKEGVFAEPCWIWQK